MLMPNINDMEGFPGPGIQTTEVRTVPNVFKYKRNAKNGVILNFQPSSQVRFEPTNGSQEVRPGGKVSFKIADENRFWLGNETLHKYRVVGYSGGNPVQSVLMGGCIIEDLNNYNLFTAHENALSSWETKQHLGIDSFRIVKNELICQFAEPTAEYYEFVLGLIQKQHALAIPMQLVWSQEFDGSNTRVQQLSLVTGEQTSISSLMLVTTNKDREDVDKLNYSDDAYIRTVSFQRNKDFNNIAFAPTLKDMEGWELNGNKIKHWSLRQNFKQTPDMIGGGLQTLADGRILINISQYPNPPEITPDFNAGVQVVDNPGNQAVEPPVARTYKNVPYPKFKGKTFHIFWTTDHEMLIDYSGVRLGPA
ncbi:hypothetical protein PhCBS80983_g06350 [Powellomyces hirtus]|uniref:Uncharacterized protein n=1 Tax=Powellomyces hirtus TaxID=109895 RepID=A0A507DNU1_9FUNG|nr:hypothetical protein PhCBS80983_g06350 [Powellomyces hirtus]